MAPEVRVLNCIFEPVSPYDNYHKNNENYFFSGSFFSGGDSSGSTRPEVKNEHEENWLGLVGELRTSRAGEIRVFREVFTSSNNQELMLRVA